MHPSLTIFTMTLEETILSKDNPTDEAVCMPATTTTKTSPVPLNNLGARLILEGRLEEALRCLASSLKIAKTDLARDKKRRSNRNPCQSEVNRKSDARSGPLQEQILQPPLPSQNFDERGGVQLPPRILGGQTRDRTTSAFRPTTRKEEGNRVSSTTGDEEKCKQSKTSRKASPSTYIFADPIVLEDRLHLFWCQHHQRECTMKLTAIISFNMGLAHHLLGRSILIKLATKDSDFENRVSLKRECRIHLKRAIAFYTLSCRIQMTERIVLDQVLAMAQLNNLAQIHDTLGNAKTSKLLFERLLSNLVLYTEAMRNNGNQDMVRRRLAGFRRNTSQFILGGPKLAPAA